MAAILFENVQPILNCTSYSFEDEDILDPDFNIEVTDDDPTCENNEDDDKNIDDDDDDDKIDDDCNRSDDSLDTDYNDECKDENIVRHQFSLEYMRNLVQFYGDRNPKTRKRNDIRKINIGKDKLQFLLHNSED